MGGLTTPAADKQYDSMAAVATQRVSAIPHFDYKSKFEQAIVQKQVEDVVKFDPKKHLAYTAPSQIVMMEDIGFPEDLGVSPMAVSQPFRLFSPEAIQQMRVEISKPEVKANHTFSSNIAANQLRGYATKYAPFALEAWNHSETLAIISKIAGVDVIPWSDYEIGNINLSMKTDEQIKEELNTINNQKQIYVENEGDGRCSWENDKPIVGWHTDSYPFVCVLMMSDCTNMVGGETALRTGYGDIMKVRGPTEGCAVLLQGRYITHQALRALGAKERITSVTSFRPRSPFLKDDSVLRTVRPVSDLSELYFDFAEYRLEMMEERIRRAHKDMRARRSAGKKFDTLGHKAFLEESIAFLEHSNNEIVEDSKVVKGYIEEVQYPNAAVAATEDTHPPKRARFEP